MEEYKDLIDDIRRLSAEEARCEVTTSVSNACSIWGLPYRKGDVCEHGNSYASNCSDCDEEVIEDTEYLDWYEEWKKKNFNYAEKEK